MTTGLTTDGIINTQGFGQLLRQRPASVAVSEPTISDLLPSSITHRSVITAGESVVGRFWLHDEPIREFPPLFRKHEPPDNYDLFAKRYSSDITRADTLVAVRLEVVADDPGDQGTALSLRTIFRRRESIPVADDRADTGSFEAHDILYSSHFAPARLASALSGVAIYEAPLPEAFVVAREWNHRTAVLTQRALAQAALAARLELRGGARWVRIKVSEDLSIVRQRSP